MKKGLYLDVDLTIIDTQRKLFPGVLEALKEMSKFYSIFVWSRTGYEHAQWVIKKYKLSRYIEAIVPRIDFLIDDEPSSLLRGANVLRVTNAQSWWTNVWSHIHHRDLSEDKNKPSLVYIAGLFDGEGCVHLKSINKGRYEKNGIQYQCMITLTMCHEETVRKLSLLYPGNKVYVREGLKKEYKTSYRWQLSGREDVKKFLLDIAPFSITKKDDISRGLRFIELLDSEEGGKWHPRSQNVLDELRELIKNNKKSPKKETK